MKPSLTALTESATRSRYIEPLEVEDKDSGPKHLNRCSWILIYLLGSLGGFSAYAYSPSLPTIQEDLNAPVFLVSASVVVNWLCRGLSSLLLGYLSDYTGRKWMILAGLVLQILGAYFCSEAYNIGMFIITIIIQGIGEGASALVFPVLREIQMENEEMRFRTLGIVSTLQSFSLFVGPTIGGLIIYLWDWRWLFRILAIWGGICLICLCALPETRPKRQKVDVNEKWYKRLAKLFESREYVSGLWFFAFYNAIIYLFLSTMSFVYEQYYGLSALDSALLISAVAGGALCGTVVSVWGLGEANSP